MGTCMTISFSNHPHRRFNALTGDWVFVSPYRSKRPWQGRFEATPSSVRPAYEAVCYLCPGNLRATNERNPHYGTTFVFDNDFAAFLADTPGAEAGRHHLVQGHALLRSATVKKFMVGYEMLAEAQRDITPEQAANRLRNLSENRFFTNQAKPDDLGSQDSTCRRARHVAVGD
jgi:galactose-1-phosphate uridylyltransferase